MIPVQCGTWRGRAPVARGCVGGGSVGEPAMAVHARTLRATAPRAAEDGGAACSRSCGEDPRTEARGARSASESWVHQQGVKLIWCDACLMQYVRCCATWCAPRIGLSRAGGRRGVRWRRDLHGSDGGRLGGMVLRMGGGQSDRRCGGATRADLGAKMDHDAWGAEANLGGERDQAGRGRARARSRGP